MTHVHVATPLFPLDSPNHRETPPADPPAASLPVAARRGSPRRYSARAASAAAPGSCSSRSPSRACANSSIVPHTPSSSIRCHRNARASALTIALSTRGRGAHAAPSGVTITFRPPRFLNVIGMWIVIASPAAETVVFEFMLPPSCRRPLPEPIPRARSAAAGPRRRPSARRPARPATARSAPARPGRVRPTADQAR